MITKKIIGDLLLSETCPYIEIDPHGDMLIEVSGHFSAPLDGPTLLVSSRALRRASPKLRRDFSHSKAKIDGAYRLEFISKFRSLAAPTGRRCPEVECFAVLRYEKPLTFTMMMRLVHGQHDRIPRHLTPELISELVGIAKEHDLMRSLRGASRRWLDSIADNACAIHKAHVGEVKHMLYTAWYLGDERIFRESVDKLARESTVVDWPIGVLHDGAGDSLSTFCSDDTRDMLDIYGE